jgi:flagellar biosynthesis protein FlhF
MQVKKYRQATVREALRAIREDLGPDALVLNTEMVSAAGWRGWMGRREVQVTAGIAGQLSAGRPAANRSRQADTPGLREDPTARQARLREDATARQATARQAASSKEAVVARLLASGLDKTLAESVVSGMPPSELRGASLKDLQKALATQLETLAAGEEAYSRVEVFIGPPGVGKTTTIAKIAAQERARKGKPLGLVGADAFRAGAVEQLRTYASIIGAPFRVARTIEDLEEAITSGRHSLLVDTAGRSPHDGGLRDLRRLLGSRRGVRTHIVMAGDTSASSARRILDAYYDARPDRVVISKVDEAESLSPLLSVLTERNIPVSYFTTGQRVPEDLDRATAKNLASVVLRDNSSAWAMAV